MKPYTVLAIIVVALTSCNRFYMPVAIDKPAPEVISNAIAESRPIVLHDSFAVYDVYKMSVTNDSLTFISEKTEGFKRLLSKRRTKVNYYYTRPRLRETIKKEIHLFSSYPVTKQLSNESRIPLASINKAEELVFDKKKTTGRHLGTALILTSVAGIVLYVVTASMSFSILGDGTGVPLF